MPTKPATTTTQMLNELKAELREVEAQHDAAARWRRSLQALTDQADDRIAELDHRLTWLSGAVHALEEVS